MEHKDRNRFWACMRVLQHNAGFEDIEDPALARIYFAVLEPYSIDQVENAIIRALAAWKSSKIIPVGIIVDMIQNEKGKADDRALIIANRIIGHIREKGSNVPPDLADDPIAAQLMKSRWPYQQWASQIRDSELTWWVKEFCEAYRAFDGTISKQIDGPKTDLKQITANMLKAV